MITLVVTVRKHNQLFTRFTRIARGHSPRSLYYCLFAPLTYMVLFFVHIPLVVNHTINAPPPERLQHYCRNWNMTPDPDLVFPKILTPGVDPVRKKNAKSFRSRPRIRVRSTPGGHICFFRGVGNFPKTSYQRKAWALEVDKKQFALRGGGMRSLKSLIVGGAEEEVTFFLIFFAHLKLMIDSIFLQSFMVDSLCWHSIFESALGLFYL